jgi:hypothetical protein
MEDDLAQPRLHQGCQSTFTHLMQNLWLLWSKLANYQLHKSGGESWGSKITTYFSTIFHWACNTCPTLLSIEHLSNEIGYPRVMARWYSPYGTRGPQKVLGSNLSDVHVKHLLALWQWAWLDLGLSTVLVRSVVLPKTRVKKDLG